MIRIKFIVAATLLATLTATSVYAKSNVIKLSHRDTSVLAVQQSILYALDKRKWQIDSNDSDGITASLQHKNIDSKLTITYDEKHVQIVDDTTRAVVLTDPLVYGQEKREHYYPRGWIKNLIVDIKHVFPTMTQKYKGGPEHVRLSDDNRAKLEQLIELHREGLLDDETFAAKKASLIDSETR